MKMIQSLVLLLSIVFTACQEKKEESFVSRLTKLSLVTAASTSNRCSISSSNNTEYFSSGSIPTGGTVSVARMIAQTGKLSLEIYYPQDSSGSLPMLVLFQGGNVHSSFYSKYSARLASAGYVVYVANRCDLFITQYFLYSPQSLVNQVLAFAETQNSDKNSALVNRLNTSRIGLLGHSLGGVIGLYAMNNICEPPFCDSGYKFLTQVKAGIFYGSGLGGNFAKNKFYTGSNGKGIPTGYIQGSADGANKPETGQASYNNAIATKVYFSVEGANHYGIADMNNPFGANPESSASNLSQADALGKISESTILFLDAYLKENSGSLAKITSANSGISSVTVSSEQ